MKQFKFSFILFISLFFLKYVNAQDVLMNIISQNAGVIKKKESTYLEITICNKSFTINVPMYKLKPQISFPNTLVNVPDSGHILPEGWVLLDNKHGVIKLTNGSDAIPISECRTILILINGKNIGGPSTITGNLTFSNGVAPGKLPGVATIGDNAADNSSTTSIKIIR